MKLSQSNLPDCDNAALGFVREQFGSTPLCILIVGSAVESPGNLSNDIDLIAFVNEGSGKKSEIGRIGSKKVECTTYDPLTFDMLGEEPTISTLMVREIRKIKNARCIQGVDFFVELLARIDSISYCNTYLRNILKGNSFNNSINMKKSETFPLFGSIEAIIFCCNFLYGKFGPRKPKWYWLDAKEYFPFFVVEMCREYIENFARSKNFKCYLEFLEENSIILSENPTFSCMLNDIKSLKSSGNPSASNLTAIALFNRLGTHLQESNRSGILKIEQLNSLAQNRNISTEWLSGFQQNLQLIADLLVEELSHPDLLKEGLLPQNTARISAKS